MVKKIKKKFVKSCGIYYFVQNWYVSRHVYRLIIFHVLLVIFYFNSTRQVSTQLPSSTQLFKQTRQPEKKANKSNNTTATTITTTTTLKGAGWWLQKY